MGVLSRFYGYDIYYIFSLLTYIHGMASPYSDLLNKKHGRNIYHPLPFTGSKFRFMPNRGTNAVVYVKERGSVNRLRVWCRG